MALSDTAIKPSENGINKDSIEDKVLKNRLAQKKFREKKQQKYKELLERCNYLESMNQELKENEMLLKKKIEQLSTKNSGDIFLEKDTPTSVDEDNASSCATSSKESENLAHLIKKNNKNGNNNIGTEMNFSFPWGSTGTLSSETNKDSSSSSLLTDDLSTIKYNQSGTELHEHNHEYDFKNGLDENNFCNTLGDACPYTPSNLPSKQSVVGDKGTFQSATTNLGGENEKSTLNNIDSVFGLPNFTFSPGFENIPSTGKSTNSIDFLGDHNLELNNLVDTPGKLNFNLTDMKAENKLVEDSSPMNFNFNFLLTNSIDENPATTNNDFKNTPLAKTEDNLLTENDQDVVEPECLNNSDDDDDVVVPGDGKLFTCSEIWDRITSNPKLSDLDLDNLCIELKTKAKCSEKGVLIKEEDLNKALKLRQEKHYSERMNK